LQSFKNTILSKNLDQNTLKNALFYGKLEKIAASVGGSAPKPPLALWRLGYLPPDLRVVISTQFTCLFLALHKFFYTNKLRSIITHLSDR